MRIRRKFLQLTQWTYPYGTEFTLESYLPKGFQRDNNDNYYIVIGNNPSTMFACHLDTACSIQEKVTHVFDGDYIRTNGTTILGADDKAGVTVILHMIENKVPGLYYFFVGEEVGCIGSGDLAEDWEDTEFTNIKKVISFDRRGTTSVITHQLYESCCSDEFANELSRRLNESGENLNMSPDDTGVVTDSAKFMEIIPECTNISVGYYNEHTVSECQDIEYLQRLCRAVVKIDWETLPIKRDPSIDDEFCDDFDQRSYYNNRGSAVDNSKVFNDGDYAFVKYDGETKKVLVSKERIIFEKDLICKWIYSRDNQGVYGVLWNGHSLYVENVSGRHEFIGNRVDIMEYVPELMSIPLKHINLEKEFDEIKKEFAV